MYLVKTYLDRSNIHGIGVFAGEDIEAGKLIWQFQENFDRSWNQEEFQSLPEIAKAYVLRRGYVLNGSYCLGVDDDAFTNHSETPNMGEKGPNFTHFALKDIKKGEEITCDYRTFDNVWREKLNAATSNK